MVLKERLLNDYLKILIRISVSHAIMLSCNETKFKIFSFKSTHVVLK